MRTKKTTRRQKPEAVKEQKTPSPSVQCAEILRQLSPADRAKVVADIVQWHAEVTVDEFTSATKNKDYAAEVMEATARVGGAAKLDELLKKS
jgi:hypothetical protein